MPVRITSGCGVYPSFLTTEPYGSEVSSTYKGRHITVQESEITTLDPLHTFQQAGHPCMVGENIVGVALTTCITANDYVAIDTEGIWNLTVVAKNPANIAVVEGDEIFINKTSAELSKDNNKNTHAHFGYALGNINLAETCVIAVKVHWDPDDAEEKVGQSGTVNLYSSDVAGKRFREYHYEATGGGYPKGDYLALTISTKSCVSAQALRRVLQWTADANWITGYGCVGEFDLEIGEGVGATDTTSLLFLTSKIEGGGGVNSYDCSWIRIQEYSSSDTYQINRLFSISDPTAAYPYAAADDLLFITLAADVEATHAMRFTVNNESFWFLVRNGIT